MAVQPNLKQLSLSYAGIHGEGFCALLNNPNITYLCMSNNNLRDANIQHVLDAIKNNHTIEALNLDACSVSSELVKALAASSSLKCLHIATDEAIADDAVFALAANQSLKELHISPQHVSVKGIKALVSNLNLQIIRSWSQHNAALEQKAILAEQDPAKRIAYGIEVGMPEFIQKSAGQPGFSPLFFDQSKPNANAKMAPIEPEKEVAAIAKPQ